MSEPRPNMAKVQALHRLHVLVVAQDRRFQRMAGFLLERAGLQVSVLHKVADALRAVERRRPDVVILDGTASLSEAARTAAVIEALHPGTTVVLVAEDDQIPHVSKLQVYPKWESFDELAAGVERMHIGLADTLVARRSRGSS
jgi:DNA-binding NtrC family response regulator